MSYPISGMSEGQAMEQGIVQAAIAQAERYAAEQAALVALTAKRKADEQAQAETVAGAYTPTIEIGDTVAAVEVRYEGDWERKEYPRIGRVVFAGSMGLVLAVPYPGGKGTYEVVVHRDTVKRVTKANPCGCSHVSHFATEWVPAPTAHAYMDVNAGNSVGAGSTRRDGVVCDDCAASHG
jgi:hypothetical protein